MIVAIIQARMGSVRFPGKVLADIEGKPMLQRVIERVKQTSCLDPRWGKIVVATTMKKEDGAIIRLAEELGVMGYPGSDADVLNRYYNAATAFGADPIIRITGDCPLIDPQVIDDAFLFFLYGGYDYVTNYPGYPDGFDVEVFSYNVLEQVWGEATPGYDWEHVTSFIRDHPDRFNIGEMVLESGMSHLKFSVDTYEDLERVRRIFRELGTDCSLADILNYV